MARKSDIRLRRSNVANAVPGGVDLNEGELAINTMDGALYFKKSNGTIITGHDDTIMHIDSDNSRVGIGTDSPGHPLDIHSGTGDWSLRALSTDAKSGIVIADNNTANYIMSQSYTLSLGNQPSLHAANLNIKSTGLVGVGIINPALQSGGHGLHIHDDVNSEIKFTNSTTGASASDGTALVTSGSSFSINNREAGLLHFGTSNTTQMSITSSGNVGIGTQSPNRKLHLSGAGSTVAVKVEATDGVQSSLDLKNSEGEFRLINDGGSLSIYDQTDTAERFRINTSGNVGIGTPSPSKPLHVQFSGDHGARIESEDNHASLYIDSHTAYGQYIRFTENNANKYWINSTGGKLVFRPNATGTVTNQVIFDATGNVGIGTDTPTSALEVNGTIRTDLIQTKTTSMSALSFLNLDMDTGASSGTNNVALASVNNMDFLIDTNNNGTTGAFVFGTDGNTMASATQLMRLTESGNLGIGTNNPVTKLHVANGSDTSDAVRISGGHASRYLAIKTFESNSLVGAGIILNASSSGGAFKFQTTSTNRMVIDHTGKVGIGTDSPQSNLHVNAGGGGGVTLEANANIDIDFRYRSGGVNKYNVAYDASAGSLIWYDNTANTTRMVLDSSGNVGIGTATPGARLEILSDGSAAGGAEIRLQHANNNTNDVVSTVNFANNAGSVAMIQGGTTGANNTGYISFFTDNAGTSAEKMRILGDGNVGIGTASPDRQLELEGQGVLRLNATGSNTDPGIDFNTSSTNDMQIRYRGATDKLAIYSYGTTTDVVTIQKSDGNVGIGESSPSQKLQVNGNIRADGSFNVGGTIVVTSTRGFNAADGTAAAPTHTFHSDQDTGMYRIGANHLGFATGGSSRWSIDSSGGITQNGGSNYDYSGGGNFNIRHLAADQNITFYTKNSSNTLSEKMRIRGDGNVGIGTQSPQVPLHVSHATAPNFRLSRTGTGQIYQLGIDSSNRFLIQEAASEGGTKNTRFVIDDTGEVGIGTSSPSHLLHVTGADGSIANMVVNNDNVALRMSAYTNSHGEIRVETNHPLVFKTNGNNERMRLDAAGQLGIGTDSPNTPLHVFSSGTTQAKFVRDLTTDVGLTIGNDSSGVVFSTIGVHHYQFYANSARRLNISATGAITFNEAFTFPNADGSANQLLQTDGSGNMSWVTVSGAGTPTYIADADGDTKVQVEESTDEDKIRFDVAGTQKMFLDSGELNLDGNLSVSGNLLIAGDINSTSVTNLDVTDKTITIANNAGSAANANGAGIVVDTGGTNPSLTYTSTDDEWNFNKNLVVGGKETTASFPLMAKSNTTHQAFHIEENSGTESYQMGVDASGDLNFYNSGNTTPILKLNDTNNLVLGHTSYTAQHSQNIGGNTDRFMAVTSNTAGQTIGYHLGVNDGSRNSRVKLFMTDDATAGNRAFGIHQTWSSGGGAPFVISMGTAERLRIDTSGNVGIGTTSPAAKLHIGGSGHILFERGGEVRSKDTGGNVRTIARVNGSNELEYGWSGAGPVKFMGGGSYTERMRIHNTNGYIGIGEIDPDKKLHVKDSNYRVAVFERTGAANAHIILRDPNTTQDVGIGATTNDLKFRAGNADHITILGSNGHLKFTDFDQKVEFGGTSNTFGYSLWNMSASAGGIIKNVAGPLTLNPDDYTSFQVNDAEHARLDGSNFDIESGGFRVNDPGNNYPFAVTAYGYMTTRSSSITQLNATDHANVPLSVLADVNTTRTASYVEIGDIGSAGNRFKINSAGNVGVGVTSIPSWANLMTNGTVAVGGILYMKTGNAIQALSDFPGGASDLKMQSSGGKVTIGGSGGNTSGHLELYGRYDDTSSKPRISFRTDHSGNSTVWDMGRIIGEDGGNYNGVLHFQVASGNGSSGNAAALATAMTIQDTKYVGIGTTAPQSILELNLHSGSASSLMNANTTNDVHLIRAPFSSTAATTSNAGAKWGLRFVGRNDNNYDNTKSGAIYAVSEDSGAGYNRKVGLAFHTSPFDASNIERMRIDSTGNVGIGTSAPLAKLSVGAGSINDAGLPVQISTGADGTQAWYAVNRNGAYGALFGYSASSTYKGLVLRNVVSSGTANADGISFMTNNTSIRMHITGAGNVGIGTTNPQNTLHVDGTLRVGPYFATSDRDHFLVTPGGVLTTVSTPNENANYDNSAGNIHIRTNSGYNTPVERLTVTSAGYVGIGTTGPSSTLEVKGASATSNNGGTVLVTDNASLAADIGGTIALRGTDGSTDRTYGLIKAGKLNSTSGGFDGYLSLQTRINGQANTTEAIRIDQNQRVGIGTDSPDTKLDITAAGVNGILLNQDTASAATSSRLMFKDNVRTNLLINVNGILQFRTDATVNSSSGTPRFSVSPTLVKSEVPLRVEEYQIDTKVTSTSATTQVAINTFAAATFRSARFTIQITNTTDSTYHSTEILAIHDGTTANITEFGEVHTGSSVEATFDADVNSGNFRLLATPTSTNSMTFKVVCHSLTV